MTTLSVNVNKIAWLRNARGGNDPDVLWATQTCINAGVHGITVHPRPDMRHIRPDDVRAIADLVTVEYNIEGNPFEGELGGYPGYMSLVREVRPAQATLVPDSVDQITSNRGWNVARHQKELTRVIGELKDLGCRVSLFMEADSDEFELVRKLGADRIELYTEDYARAHGTADCAKVLERYADAARHARESGLGVNAGHDLNLDNLADFLVIPEILEVSIGHALICDALKYGLEDTVHRYLACLPKNPPAVDGND
ncbi:MAG: pyridoxine 5'-phosphate synthase [Gammaproteobacteria bacterium]|nr:pyridoxine 5'-phosphate synthase [Gammaproteobacteria bacterium]